jgi:maltose/moltooligosaccharide transporter
VAAIIPVIILEPLAARYGRVKVHTLSIAVMAVGYLNIFYFGNTAWSLYLLMAVVGIGWAATISLPFAIMSQKIPQARMGLYMGLFNLSVVLPQFVSSLGIGEWVEAASDKSIIFIICAVTIAISAIAWSRVKEPIDRFTENPVLVQPDND